MADSGERPEERRATPRRVDARRNAETIVQAAAAAFVEVGVDAPVREIGRRAGVGLGTIYRHFPTRADLIVAVYRHQIADCAAAGSRLLEEESSPFEALTRWTDHFVDLVATKHGLAEALQSDEATYAVLHEHFLAHLLPVCDAMLSQAEQAGEITVAVSSFELLRGIGNLCIGVGDPSRYEPRRLVALLLSGLGAPSP
jgi:AcrR family transcriptional regulator